MFRSRILVVRVLPAAFLLGILVGPLADRSQRLSAASPAVWDTVANPGPNRSDEPLADAFSLQRAVSFLDAASLTWQKQQQCFACHTNYAYLYARPLLPGSSAAHAEVRRAAEQLVAERWVAKKPRWDAEVVATAAALAFHDAATSGQLSPLARQALDRMWTVQRPDGGWNWLKCGWPPMESDEHYGATLAAIAVGVAPGGYVRTEPVQAGLTKLLAYFRNNPPPTLHHEAMLLWGRSYLPELLTDGESRATIEKLSQLQRPDGGWALAALGDWKRADGTPQDRDHSDGYGTGFVVYVLRRAGVAADDPRIKSGIAWLKSHQRVSGRWFTRSLHADGHHYITHAGSAFAVMALQVCTQESAK